MNPSVQQHPFIFNPKPSEEKVIQKDKLIIYINGNQSIVLVNLLKNKLPHKSKNELSRLIRDGAIKWLGEDTDWIIKFGDTINIITDDIDEFMYREFLRYLDNPVEKFYGCFKIGKREYVWL